MMRERFPHLGFSRSLRQRVWFVRLGRNPPNGRSFRQRATVLRDLLAWGGKAFDSALAVTRFSAVCVFLA
jgi:hypothetical protein